MTQSKFYICPVCGDLTTAELMSKIQGHYGLCPCQFTKYEWRKDIGQFDVVTLREFTEYVEIPELVWDQLKEEPNHVTRLEMYNSWRERR